MTPLWFLVTAGAHAVAVAPSPPAPHATEAVALAEAGEDDGPLPSAARPGFAAVLAERPLAPETPPIARDAAWAALARSTAATRQSARWDLATGEIARGRGADAIGILAVMLADDPDLALVPAWHRASGIAAAQAGHDADALVALDDEALGDDADTCLWRMRVLADLDRAAEAIQAMPCAMPALNRLSARARAPFVLAGAQAGIARGLAQPALAWLAHLPDGDPAANLLRGRALALAGDGQAARLRFDRVAISGTPAERAAARLALIAGDLDRHAITPAEAGKRLDPLLFSWRGDATEEQALRLAIRAATAAHDRVRLLAVGAALFRYGPPRADTPALLATLRGVLAAALAPDSPLDLATAAGLSWDYRDIAPAGVEGTRLAEALVDRLQAAGLYGRAADLLQHRLDSDAQDVEQGPLSVRIASLRILAGRPDAAIRTLRATDAVPYPPAMRADRLRVEAAALHLAGRRSEALAALADVPGAAPLRAELYWRAHDWAHLAAAGAPLLPHGPLGEVGQAVVLRQAIALAMLGRDAELARLRARYAAAFAPLPSNGVFAMLTGRPGAIDAATFGKAMAALPSASPAGAFADLLDDGAAAAG